MATAVMIGVAVLGAVCAQDLAPRWYNPWRLGVTLAFLALAANKLFSGWTEAQLSFALIFAFPVFCLATWLGLQTAHGVNKAVVALRRKFARPVAERIEPTLPTVPVLSTLDTELAALEAEHEAYAQFMREQAIRERLLQEELEAAVRREQKQREREAAEAERVAAEFAQESLEDDPYVTLAPSDEPRPWWEVLDVSPDAPFPAVLASYRSKIKQHHPDRVSGLAEEFTTLAEARTKEINAAFSEAKQSLELAA